MLEKEQITEVASKIEGVLSGTDGLEQKNMFGGVQFSINGNMVARVNKQGVALRVGKDNYEEMLEMPGIDKLMLGEKPMNGMVTADASVYDSDEKLEEVVKKVAGIVSALPPKEK